jgi:hypothetical protein
MAGQTQIVRFSEKLILDVKAGGNFLGALNFKLSDLATYASLSLYDQYRIDRIEVTICPQLITNVTKGTLGADMMVLPLFVTAVDLDDSTTPATLAAVLSNPTAQIHGVFNHNVVRSFVPNIAMSAYQGAFTGYAAEEPQWLDTATPDIQHYGLKYSVEAAPVTTSSQLIVFYAKMWVSLRHPLG